MKILATKTVLDGSEINILYKENDAWLLISNKEFEENYQFDEDNLFIIEEDYLYDRIPALKGKLNQPNKTNIYIDYKTGEVNINKHHVHFGIPTHGAVASRQSNAGFSYLHYLITTRSWYRKPFIKFAIQILLGLIFGWFFYITAALYFAFYLLSFLKTRDMYYSGALCPAIVIDAKNSKIAALSDLSMGFGHYPVIRIRKFPMPSKYLKNGLKIPVAGGYNNTEKYTHWNYFEPQPLPSAIKDDNIIQNKINQIPTLEWIELKNEIKKLEGIPKEGYYPINIESSDWKDVDLENINWMQFDEEK